MYRKLKTIFSSGNFGRSQLMFKNVFLSSTPRAFLIHKSDLEGVLGGCKPEGQLLTLSL